MWRASSGRAAIFKSRNVPNYARYSVLPVGDTWEHVQFVSCNAYYGMKRVMGGLMNELHWKCSAEKEDGAV
jgi:hypothetical protein